MTIKTPGRYQLREALTIRSDEGGMRSIPTGDLIMVISIDERGQQVFVSGYGWVDWGINAVRHEA